MVDRGDLSDFLDEEGHTRMSAAFGSSTGRLASVKEHWDPHGTFRTHQTLRTG